jgi:phage tail protein X
MSSQYRTKTGDTVDSIAWAYYGRQSNRVVEQVLEANFGLAEHGPSLPAGLIIVLPDIDDTQQQTEGVKLWD